MVCDGDIMLDENGKVMRKCEPIMNKICRTLFISFVGIFTNGQQKYRGCLDYMVHTLFNGNFECFEKLIKRKPINQRSGRNSFYWH